MGSVAPNSADALKRAIAEAGMPASEPFRNVNDLAAVQLPRGVARVMTS
jgi:hypothetical protein